MITSGDKSGFSVSIQRPSGEAFNEHDVQQTKGMDGRPSVTSCWLESETDAVFEIKYEINPEAMRRSSPFDWAIYVSVDGREVHRGTMMHTTSSAAQYTVSHMTFKENGVAYEGRLKFAALKTTDNKDEVTLQGVRLKRLGKIRIDFHRGTRGTPMQNPEVRFLIDPDVGIAAEKTKKYVSIPTRRDHYDQADTARLGGGIGYADKRPATLIPTIDWKPHDKGHLPYHRIEFNYRPKAVLQLRGIIDYDVPEPRPQSPPPPARQKGKIGKRTAEVIHIDEDTFEPPNHSQAGPSVEVKAEMLALGPPPSSSGTRIRKRKLEVIDIEDEEEARPEVQARLSTRVGWLERQLQTANELLKRKRIYAPGDLVDLTGDD